MYSLEGRPMPPPPRKGSSFVGNPVYDVQNECRIPKGKYIHVYVKFTLDIALNHSFTKTIKI